MSSPDTSLSKRLAHPALRPAGLTPLLGGDAARDRAYVNRLLDAWAAQGFTQVAPTQIDDAEILLAEQSPEVQNRAFRFMDPQNGTMLALLPDVTLGIARLAAGELAAAARPLRLSYEGQAIRVYGSTARPTRQFGQVGLEVIGADAQTPQALISLALSSLKALGLAELHLCLVFPPLAKALLAARGLPEKLAQALDRKDEGTIRALAGDQAAPLLAILGGELDGEPALQNLKQLQAQLAAAHGDVELRCEPFEQRGFGFQTGPAFAVYSPHFHGEIGRGGAYRSGGEACFGFTLYRDALLATLRD